MSIPQRKSPRAKWLEYNEGMYFITICTNNRIHYFGEIDNNKLKFSPIGEFLHNELAVENTHHRNVKVLQFVVMPNHFHAIVELSSNDTTLLKNSDTARRVPTIEERMAMTIKTPLPRLSSFVGGLKSAITKYAHSLNLEFAWQPRYHDHAIRGVNDMNNISTYIENNVEIWQKDCFY
jgi:REP element-mobilizing transposase RayT